MSIQIDRSINKALKLRTKRRLEEAIHTLEEVCKIEPDNEQATNYLAKMKLEKFRRAAGSNPPLDIQQKLKLLFDTKKWQSLITACRPVEEYFPNSVPILNMLGVAYRETGDLEKSNISHFKALKSDPKESTTYLNLANCYIAQGKFAEALTLLRTHLSVANLKEESIGVSSKLYDCLGNSLYYVGLYKEAHTAYETAINIDPANDEARFNLGAIKLVNKEFESGWKLREFRRFRSDFLAASQSIKKPQWFGEKDAVVLCWAEQGLGDEVMAASCLNELSELTGKLIVSADKRLLSTFTHTFPHIEFISRDNDYQELDFDYHIPSMTAVGMLRPSEASFKQVSKGYLAQNEDLVFQLRNEIKAMGGEDPIIGISWKTGAAVTGKRRTVDLKTLLSAIPERFTVVNLQYDECSDEIEHVERISKRKILRLDHIDTKNDIESFGALMCACDQILTIDNSTVHFAGAFGIKCHLLLPKASDYRWSEDGETTYWYDSVKIVRQPTDGAWSKCLAMLKEKLQ